MRGELWQGSIDERLFENFRRRRRTRPRRSINFERYELAFGANANAGLGEQRVAA